MKIKKFELEKGQPVPEMFEKIWIEGKNVGFVRAISTDRKGRKTVILETK